MITRLLFARGRSALLLAAAFVLVSLAACSGSPAHPPPTSPAAGGSVQDQLAQLAAGAASATPSAATEPGVRASATPTAGQDSAARPTPTRTKRPTSTRAPRGTPTPTPSDTLPTITRAQLPPEARNTIRLIEQGGPFPYPRDGITFGNREGLLPKRPNGYYKEYTVVTPGSSDRGARRIIAGQAGELYYTDDHYDSFKRVVP